MAERLTIEHYVSEAFVKCAQVILSSRISTGTRLVPDKRSSRWFLLELEELEDAKAELSAWRKDGGPSGLHRPLIIEIYIQPHGSRAVVSNRDGTEHATGAGAMLLERWTLQYLHAESSRDPYGGRSGGGATSGGLSGSARSYVDEASVYKRLIILIRSLYSYARVLPAYRIYRKRYPADLFTMGYRIVPSAAARSPAARGGTASQLQRYDFAPVETPGNAIFRVAVEYQSSATVHILEQSAAPTCVPRIIPDYLDGPAPPPGFHRTASFNSSGAARYPMHSDDARGGAHYGNAMAASVCEGGQRYRVGDGVSGTSPPPSHIGFRPSSATVIRQSWSSKQMYVTLPLNPTSPAGVLTRKSSSGLGASAGSTPPTPSSPSPFVGGHPHPVDAANRPPLPQSTSLPRASYMTAHRAALMAASASSPGKPQSAPGDVVMQDEVMADAAPGHQASTSCSTATAGHDASMSLAIADSSSAPGGAAAPVLAPGHASSVFSTQQAVRDLQMAGLTSEGAAAAVAAPAPSPSPSLPGHVSAPVMIPTKSCRARSVADFGAQYGFDVPAAHLVPGADSRDSMDTEGSGGAGAAPGGLGGGRRSLVAAGSAPAAPRGMLGQALMGALAKAAQPDTHNAHAAPQDGVLEASATQLLVQPLTPGLRAASVVPQLSSTTTAAAAVCSGGARGPRAMQGGPPPGSYEGSGSSYSSAAHMSCSPQLPFAVTPSGYSGHSLASLAEHHALVMATPLIPTSFHHQPSAPCLVARDISALATIRRPSWSSRSSSFDVMMSSAAGGGGPLGVHLGASPLGDLLESSLSVSMSVGNTPQRNNTMRRFSPASPTSIMAGGHQSMMPASGAAPSAPSASHCPVTTAISQDCESGPVFSVEESESDFLPFALDNDVPASARDAGCQPASLEQGSSGAGGSTALVRLVAPESDAAVGAFIRMLQDAPPLSLGPGVEAPERTAAEALAELSGLAQQLKTFIASECR